MSSLLEIIQTATIELPVLELTFLMSIQSVCLVLHGTRIGLIAAYIFTYRWGWMFMTEHQERYLVGYLIFGGLVGVLTVVDMLRGSDHN